MKFVGYQIGKFLWNDLIFKYELMTTLIYKLNHEPYREDNKSRISNQYTFLLFTKNMQISNACLLKDGENL